MNPAPDSDPSPDSGGDHPALVASQNSWKYAQAGDKEGWLGIMRDDVVIEDPIGVAPTNPDGQGVRGKAAVAEFFDANIAVNDLTIEPQQTFLPSNDHEVAHVLKLTSRFDNGVVSEITGIFVYVVDDDGLLTNMRGYWNMDEMVFTEGT